MHEEDCFLNLVESASNQQLIRDIIFMRLKYSNDLLDIFLIQPQEERQTLIQPSYVVKPIKDLKVALPKGLPPGLLRFLLNLRPGRQPFADAALQHFLKIESTEVNVGFEVVIYFAQVLQRCVGGTHQEIDIEVMLPPQELPHLPCRFLT